MVAVEDPTGGSVPAHVPADRVLEWTPETNPEMPNDPWAAYEKLREVAPGVFWSPGSMDGKGVWFATSYELCREVLQEHKRFTTTMDFAPGINNAWPRRLIPLELDPPDHQRYRSLLTPLFAPAAIDRLEAGIVATATELIDDVVDDGHCDFMSQFASLLPGTVFIQLLGLDPSETRPVYRLGGDVPPQRYCPGTATGWDRHPGALGRLHRGQAGRSGP